MTQMQIGFLIATFALPLLLCVLAWRWRVSGRTSASLERPVNWGFATILIFAYVGSAFLARFGEVRSLDFKLPMHLCDWATVATLIALLRRTPAAFDVAYCWGIAGTLQGILTPAIVIDGKLHSWTFLTVHSVIPAAVLWMLLGAGHRPSSKAWVRVVAWSQIYFAAAIIANKLLDSNYGFLARRPPKATLLDYFPDPAGGWAYMLAIDAFAITLFTLMIVPWRLGKRRESAG